MHLNGLNTQHGKSHSIVASQGTSRASSPPPDDERIQLDQAALAVTEANAVCEAAVSVPVPAQDGKDNLPVSDNMAASDS